MDHILSIVLFTPLAGLLVLLFIPSSNPRAVKLWANAVALVGFLVSLPLVFQFDPGKDFQFVENAPWIPTLGASYHLGIDGLGLLLVMLTTLIGFLAILSSWNAIHDRLKEYYAFFLLLQTGMLGVFMALDFLLFFVFWETVLVPMYFIIAIWGGQRRVYAAIKFMIYTLIGRVLMLLGILTLYFQHYQQFQTYSFDITELMRTTLSPGRAVVGLLGLLRGLRGEGADVPLPHLAAGRAYRSAHRGLRGAGQRTAEDGDIRFPAILPAAAARLGQESHHHHRHGGAVDHRDCLRRPGLA